MHEIKPGQVLEELLDEGLVQHVVGPGGLKLELTAEGNAFFAARTKNPPLPVKFHWYHAAIVVFFIIILCYQKYL
jgi:hypothetical protein